MFSHLLLVRQLEDDKLAEQLAAAERAAGRDQVEQLVKSLGWFGELAAALAQCRPRQPGRDPAFAGALTALENELERVERGEIESLLRCYKFQKYAVSGWKLMPKV